MIRTPRMVQQHQHSKTVRIIINKSRILDCALFCCKARRKRLEHERSLGRDTRCSALAAFCVLYNRTVHSFLCLFYDKESDKFLTHYFKFDFIFFNDFIFLNRLCINVNYHYQHYLSLIFIIIVHYCDFEKSFGKVGSKFLCEIPAPK